MKKKIVIRILISLTLIITVLSFVAYNDYKKNLTEIYTESLKIIIDRDNDIHSDKEQFAINTESLVGLTDSTKKEVLNNIENSYGISTIDASYEDLIERGIEENHKQLSSLILYVEDIKSYGIITRVYVAKEYGGLGANGIAIDFVYFFGEWKPFRIINIWVS